MLQQATAWGCERLYLTSEPDNSAAHGTWLSLGFIKIPGDRSIDGVSVISNYKGPGKDRAVYELMIADLPEDLDDLPRDRPTWVICSNSHRASIAASLLDRAGIPVRLIGEGGVGEWRQRCAPVLAATRR